MYQLSIEKIGPETPWVARIKGVHPKYGLDREFVRGAADYSRANSVRSRGVYYLFTLPDGLYEIKGGTSWATAGNRKFISVIGGEAETITLEQVMQLLAPPKDETRVE